MISYENYLLFYNQIQIVTTIFQKKRKKHLKQFLQQQTVMELVEDFNVIFIRVTIWLFVKLNQLNLAFFENYLPEIKWFDHLIICWPF